MLTTETDSLLHSHPEKGSMTLRSTASLSYQTENKLKHLTFMTKKEKKKKTEKCIHLSLSQSLMTLTIPTHIQWVQSCETNPEWDASLLQDTQHTHSNMIHTHTNRKSGESSVHLQHCLRETTAPGEKPSGHRQDVQTVQ